MAGCGGILRNEQGEFLFAFAYKLDHCSVLEAELWAIYHGLSIVWGRGFRNLVVESDSANAIRLLSEVRVDLDPLSHLVRGIKNMISQEAEIRWDHVLREANQLADILAKESSMLASVCKIYDVIPPSFR